METMVISNDLFYQRIEWQFGWHETKSREIVFTVSFGSRRGCFTVLVDLCSILSLHSSMYHISQTYSLTLRQNLFISNFHRCMRGCVFARMCLFNLYTMFVRFLSFFFLFWFHSREIQLRLWICVINFIIQIICTFFCFVNKSIIIKFSVQWMMDTHLPYWHNGIP